MKTTRIMVITALIAGGGLALHAAPQQAKRLAME